MASNRHPDDGILSSLNSYSVRIRKIQKRLFFIH